MKVDISMKTITVVKELCKKQKCYWVQNHLLHFIRLADKPLRISEPIA